MVHSQGKFKNRRLVSLDRVVRVLRDEKVAEEIIDNMVASTEPRLITIAEASERYGIPYGTLLNWLSDGKLEERGRIPFPAPGRGKVLIDEADIIALVENPPRPGRPRKVPL